VGLRVPSWWYDASKTPPVGGVVLEWVARAYAAAVERRYNKVAPVSAKVPVICIGNFTAGGTGKTPLALYVARLLSADDKQVAFLTRGYGGRARGPVWVAPETHVADDVGDEPLLLAEAAPVVVARDRAAGANLITRERSDIDAIVMDDGMQNPGLKKDLVLAVVDGQRGLGNGRVIPAGPLRGDLDFQVGLADAIVITEIADHHESAGDGDRKAAKVSVYDTLRAHFPGPVLRARYGPSTDVSWLKGHKVLAFAGIGNPDRFFDMLTLLGADVVATRAFADHHTYMDADAESLLRQSRDTGATLATTAKDLARLSRTSGALATLRDTSRAIPVALQFSSEEETRLKSLIDSAVLAAGEKA
jgi:tetraacyldisaccharide 4'-kinase